MILASNKDPEINSKFSFFTLILHNKLLVSAFILLETKSQILIVKDEFGGTEGLVTMEDVIETLLGVEIVDESDQVAIDEGSHHEDMRELAKQRVEESE